MLNRQFLEDLMIHKNDQALEYTRIYKDQL
jgi:hypothetical protein